MYLTVPLPISQHRQLKLHFIARDPEKPPIHVRLLIPQNASFMQVKEKLAALVKCNSSQVGPLVKCERFPIDVISFLGSIFGKAPCTRGGSMRSTMPKPKTPTSSSFTSSRHPFLHHARRSERLPSTAQSPCRSTRSAPSSRGEQPIVTNLQIVHYSLSS